MIHALSQKSTGISYSPWARRGAALLSLGILVVSVLEYLIVWVRVISTLLHGILGTPDFSAPNTDVFHTLLVSHASLFAALYVARALAYVTPQVQMLAEGLRFEGPLGVRVIPYASLKGVESVQVEPDGRFIVWVESRPGLPLQNLIASLIFGRWFWSGFVLTSDLQGFDGVVARIVEALQHKYGAEAFEKHFGESAPSWIVRMLVRPAGTIHELATQEVLSVSQREATFQMISAAASLGLPLALAELMHLQLPLRSILLFLLALGEWPLASLFLTAVPMGELRVMKFDDAMRLYPMTQLPRWLGALVLAWLVLVGAPVVLLFLAVLPIIAMDCYWAAHLVKGWFAVRMSDALVGVFVTGVCQFVLFMILLVLLPR